MDNCYTIDMEDAVQAALNADGIRACAPPVPSGLAGGMAVVYRVGGSGRSYVQDVHALSIDCYGIDAAQAVDMADSICGWLRALPGKAVGGVPCYSAEVTTLPYLNPDPSHQTLQRCTLAADVATRVQHRKN